MTAKGRNKGGHQRQQQGPNQKTSNPQAPNLWEGEEGILSRKKSG